MSQVQSNIDQQVKSSMGKSWLWAVLPIILLVAIIAAIMTMGTGLDEESPVPIENLDVEKVMVTDVGFILKVLNSSPQEITIAQAIVGDAYWNFHAEPDAVIPRLGRATITIPYPWVEGDGYEIRLVTEESSVFSTEIDAAVQTPEASGQRIWQYALIGFYVGVVPVALGLMWFPFMRRFSSKGMHAVLAFTVGLLVFLVVDTIEEGLEIAAGAPEVFQGTGLVWFGAILSFLFLLAVDQGKGRKDKSSSSEGKSIAYKLAAGIGLHNFGEGLAIGTAFAVGEVALGTFLIIGFTLHNITEGIGIAAPLTRTRPTLATFIWLAVIGGAPAIAGVWAGGFVFNNTLAALFFGIGAGAIAQVIFVITKMVMKESAKQQYPLLSWRNFTSVTLGIVVMYATALLVSS